MPLPVRAVDRRLLRISYCGCRLDGHGISSTNARQPVVAVSHFFRCAVGNRAIEERGSSAAIMSPFKLVHLPDEQAGV